MDIAIYLANSVSLVDIKLDILGGLMDILQTDEIDLVVLNEGELPLVMEILKNKKVIVDKEPFVRHLFESLSMRKYFDFSIMEEAILRERYLDGR